VQLFLDRQIIPAAAFVNTKKRLTQNIGTRYTART